MDTHKEQTVKAGFETALRHYSLTANYDINTTLINKIENNYWYVKRLEELEVLYQR